jgi:hypothetical protein
VETTDATLIRNSAFEDRPEGCVIGVARRSRATAGIIYLKRVLLQYQMTIIFVQLPIFLIP